MSADQATLTTAVRTRIAAAHRTALMIVLALSLSVALYVAVGLMVIPADGAQDGPQLRIPFYVGALFLALGSITVRRTQLRRIRLEAIARAGGVDAVVKHFATVTIISAAIAEAIGLMALLISFFGGDGRDVVTIGLISLLVLLSNYPRRAAWERTATYFASDPAA